MTLREYLDTLHGVDCVYVGAPYKLNMVHQEWAIDMIDYENTDDYVPEELLNAKILEHWPKDNPYQVVVDL